MELIGVYEIASLAGVSPQAVSNWVTRKYISQAVGATRQRACLGRGGNTFLARAGEPDPRYKTKEQRNEELCRRHRIHAQRDHDCAGWETMSYMTQSDNRIVCGRFTEHINPKAPYEILVGDLPKVRRKAEALAAQGGTIPVFMKERQIAGSIAGQCKSSGSKPTRTPYKSPRAWTSERQGHRDPDVSGGALAPLPRTQGDVDGPHAHRKATFGAECRMTTRMRWLRGKHSPTQRS